MILIETYLVTSVVYLYLPCAQFDKNNFRYESYFNSTNGVWPWKISKHENKFLSLMHKKSKTISGVNLDDDKYSNFYITAFLDFFLRLFSSKLIIQTDFMHSKLYFYKQIIILSWIVYEILQNMQYPIFPYKYCQTNLCTG